MLPYTLQKKLNEREANHSLRSLKETNNLIDFSSNDYLGFSQSKGIFKKASEILKKHHLEVNGATGSRLLSGNHKLYTETETQITSFHNTKAALIFNSGYDANIGFFSSVPQRGDVILYDELCHASIRDGIKMSNAKAFKFKHNDLRSVAKLLIKLTKNYLPLGEMSEGQRGSSTPDKNLYIVTESIFSMDGDQPDIKALVALCKKYECHLVIDEAHAIGVIGDRGEGLVQLLGLEDAVFARIVTFGKALGCHGAAILGGEDLKNYLINFSRSFIYTTGLPPHSVATIQAAYQQLTNDTIASKQLKSNIAILQKCIERYSLQDYFIPSTSAIHSCIVGGNENTRSLSNILTKTGFDVKAILAPTVLKGQERLRICLHSFNTHQQIKQLILCVSNSLNTQ